MKVEERYGIEAAPHAEGHVVVIDVLRAFTTTAYAFAAGAESIVLVKEPEDAFALKEKRKDLLLIGEVGGVAIPGFDFGNSPEQVSKADLRGRRLVLRSSSGTQGVVGAAKAGKVFLGSLVVARATADALKREKADIVTLVAMGSTRALDREEDIACSNYIAGLLGGMPLTPEEAARRVKLSPAGMHALDPAVEWISPEDLELASLTDRFDFAMPVSREAGLLIARPLRP